AKQHLKTDGELKIFINNIAHIDNLTKLITGNFSSELVKLYKLNIKTNFQIKELESDLKNLSLKIITVKHYAVFAKPDANIQSFVQLLNKFIPGIDSQKLNTFGYLITAT